MPYDVYNQVSAQVLAMSYAQKINLLALIANSLRESKTSGQKSSIENRIAVLSENLDEDQDSELFSLSVSLFRSVFPKLITEEPPRLGLDDSGVLVAEWDNYGDYTMVTIRFGDEKQISLVAVKDGRLVNKCVGITDEIISVFNRL